MKKFFILLLISILLSGIFAGSAYASPNRPVVVIDSVETIPNVVVPGKEFELKVNLKNEGNQSARWVTLQLASIEGNEGLGSFSVLNNDNTIHYGRMDSDGEAVDSFSMITAGDIKPGIYNINFVLTYTNHQGVGYETNHVSGIIVTEEDAISLYNVIVPMEVEIGDEITIEGEFVNMGKHDIENVMIKISGGLDMTPSEYFVGTMAPGDMDMFVSRALADKSGDMNIKIEAIYMDSMNQRTGTTVEKVIKVSEPRIETIEESIEKEEDKGGFFRSIGNFFKRLLGLG